MSRPCRMPTCYKLQPCPDHPKPRAFGNARRSGGRAWQATRQRILQRDHGLCQLRYAGCTIVAEVIDHVLNRARGGTDDSHNLQAACKRCNEQKRRVEARYGKRH